ncbi:glycosyltransferase family 2 protein [Candidatus Roizmanbacteria bacterium]|nr:glycosyltransferase family 2 protein [Candidatus Roizmanbacteria bacterium]
MKQLLISVIIPCYNEQDNILPMYERIKKVFKSLPYGYEMIFVDNDSIDQSEKIFTKLAKRDKNVKVILMSRNFGSPQPSFIAGLDYSKGYAAVLLHGDIQDPPELIPEFIKKWNEGYDVVYGIRKDRKGYGLVMNFFYKFFYFLLRKLSYISIPLNAGEFSIMDRKVIKELLKIEEYDYYLRCLRAFVGFKQIGIEYQREAREQGKSTESFWSGLWWAKTIIINFSFKPLEWISQLAFIMVVAAFISIIGFLIYYYFNPDSPRGIPTLFILILFLGGIQLLSISVIAEYLAKIFLEVKRRPKYIIRKTLNF